MIEGLNLDKPLSLYIHIPFCISKCSYCGFYSLPSSSSSIIDSYFNTLQMEIEQLLREYQYSFHTLYIGGGNPALIGFDRLLSLISQAERNGRPKEITIEVNPENVTEEINKLKGRVDRISVGIQSLREKSLALLGRNTTVEQSRRALAILKASNIDFNADIMTSIPRTTTSDTLRDIEEIASYSPSHISLYNLTLEEGTPLFNRAKSLNEEEEREFLLSSWKRLKELGYEHYEISNFAKSGKRSEHNMSYWRLGQYIGLGPTAESSLGYERVVSMRNRECLEDYLSSQAFTKEYLTEKETMEELLIVALRTSIGVDKIEFQKRFSLSFDEIFSNAINRLDNSLFNNSSTNFSLTEEGMLLLDHIILTLALSI